MYGLFDLELNGYESWYLLHVTSNFHVTHHFDLGFSRWNFENDHLRNRLRYYFSSGQKIFCILHMLHEGQSVLGTPWMTLEMSWHSSLKAMIVTKDFSASGSIFLINSIIATVQTTLMVILTHCVLMSLDGVKNRWPHWLSIQCRGIILTIKKIHYKRSPIKNVFKCFQNDSFAVHSHICWGSVVFICSVLSGDK